LRSSSSSSPCTLIGGDGEYRGFVSAAGGLTAQASYTLRCVGGPYGSGIDYAVVATLTMTRR